MSNSIGTLAWTRSTGGELSAAESRSLMGELLRAQLTLIPDEWLHKRGIRRARTSGLSTEDLLPPDSATATGAAKACRDISPEYLYNHCARSYGWARILGAQLGVQPDPELLYVAAMFHDFGLTEAYGAPDERPACFAAIGANEAARNLANAGWDAERIDRACEAITLHLNIGVKLSYGPEAHLLNLATALDTTGLRTWRLTPDDMAMVLDEHPRLNQNTALASCFVSEAKRFPRSRAGWLEQNIKFSKRLRRAPFRDRAQTEKESVA